MPFTLFDHQEEAVKYLEDVEAAAIGDDRGLGKTVEGLERDVRLRTKKVKLHKYRTLIITPAGAVMDGWVDHIKFHTPDVVVERYDSKRKAAFLEAALKGTADYYIVHWQALRLLPELRRIRWFHIIADEVHRAANRKAQQTQALKKLTTFFMTGMSGTIAPDKVDQLWSILNWLYPTKYKGYWAFVKEHVNMEAEYAKGRVIRKVAGPKNEKLLQEQIKPFFVRRLKEEVLKDLPEKYYTTYFVDLLPQQRKAYDEMRKNMLAWIGEHEDQPVAAPIVVSQLVRLQQFAVAYGRMERFQVKKRCTKGKEAHGCAGYHLEWRQRLVLDDPSSKLDLAMALLEEATGTNPVVVFSQSKQAINLLEKRLQAVDVQMGKLTGDIPENERGAVVEAFQLGKLPVIGATIATGGEGITLTRSSTEIFIDRTWSPARNLQAEDRCHRIGQKNAVQVFDILAKSTVDLGRMQHIELKWSYLQTLLGDKPDQRRFIREGVAKEMTENGLAQMAIQDALGMAGF